MRMISRWTVPLLLITLLGACTDSGPLEPKDPMEILNQIANAEEGCTWNGTGGIVWIYGCSTSALQQMMDHLRDEGYTCSATSLHDATCVREEQEPGRIAVQSNAESAGCGNHQVYHWPDQGTMHNWTCYDQMDAIYKAAIHEQAGASCSIYFREGPPESWRVACWYEWNG